MVGVPDDRPEAASTRPALRPARPADLTFLGIPAEVRQLGFLRNSIGDWLAGFVNSEVLRSDILLASYEAIANVVFHAYPDGPGVLDVCACVTAAEDMIAVTIADYGRWDSTVGSLPFHGLGLPLIRALAAESEITSDDSGTRVQLRWPNPSAAGV